MIESELREYSKLIYKISKKFYGVERDDLIQAGYLGLLKAKKNYNNSSDSKFSTYAYKYIYGEMYEIINKSNKFAINKDVMKIYNKLRKTRELMEMHYQREISMKEVCEYLNIDENYAFDVLQAFKDTLDVYDAKNYGYDVDVDKKIMLDNELQKLNQIEKSILIERYYNDLSQTQTAENLGINQVKVYRLEKKAIEKLKNNL